MKEKIVKAYMEYRKILIKNYEYPEHFNVVIKICPGKMMDLIKEIQENNTYFERDIEAGCHFIELAGRKTPVIIDNNLPKDTEFIIQSQKDYEREQEEKQLKIFFKMFGE